MPFVSVVTAPQNVPMLRFGDTSSRGGRPAVHLWGRPARM